MPPGHSQRRPALRPQLEWSGTVERLGWGGVGVGRLDDGRVVLLKSPLALFPGEVVCATIELHPRHAEGVVERWLTRDSRRVVADCAVAATCGGCSLWESGAAAAELKWAMVQDLLARQLRAAPPCLWLPAPPGTVRSRIQLGWDGATLGYHRSASNELVAVSGCPMAVGPVSAAIPALRSALSAGELPAQPDRWELATGTPPKEVVATAARQPDSAWLLAGGAWQPAREPLVHELGGLRLSQPPGAFFQVCPAWAWQAFGELFGKWELAGNKLSDLYGGSGFFSMLLADRFSEALIVESGRDSCAAAAANIAGNAGELHGLRLSVKCADVAAWLPAGLGEPGDAEQAVPGDAEQAVPGDVILLDPPRAGLPRSLAAQLLTARASAIVLIGCDGMSFCRDVRRLAPDWTLARLAAIDLFPNTHQVEFVGLLRR